MQKALGVTDAYLTFPQNPVLVDQALYAAVSV
jgi:hypothetical protein